MRRDHQQPFATSAVPVVPTDSGTFDDDEADGEATVNGSASNGDASNEDEVAASLYRDHAVDIS